MRRIVAATGLAASSVKLYFSILRMGQTKRLRRMGSRNLKPIRMKKRIGTKGHFIVSRKTP